MFPIFRHSKTLAFIGVAACGLALSACDSTVITCQTDCTTDEGNGTPNLVETALAAGNFTTLTAALETAGLSEVLSDDTQSYTVFAPTDAAFEALGQAAVDALLADSVALNDTLLYHVLPGSVDAATAVTLAGTTIAMQNNKAASLTLDGDSLKINDANVIQTDIVASNGIIHVIDAVLTPPAETIPVDLVQTVTNNGNFTTLLAALEASGLDAVLADASGDYTLFAPTDDAFNALGIATINGLLTDADALNSVLQYHVLAGTVDSTTAIGLAGNSVTMQDGSIAQLSVEGETLKINDASVTTADIAASNGIVHIIDAVLVPADVEITPVPVDLVATLKSLPDYSTLTSHLKTTGLEETLNDSARTFTVFAPDNAAFEAAAADIQAALATDAGALETVLLGHVFPDSIVDAATASNMDGQSITMADGSNKTITVTDGTVSIDGAAVVDADIDASNGVIHGIDAVLLNSAE